MIKSMIKSIFAGVMVGIACLVNLNVGAGWIGAILFSVGLLIIVYRGYNLFTGVVGYISTFKEIPFAVTCFIGNFIGLVLVALSTDANTELLVSSKLVIPLYQVFIKSIGCGYLMFTAVDIYKSKNNDIVGILFCVPAFILAGFEHCIADIFYVILSGMLDIEVLVFLLVVILGNITGAQIGRVTTERTQ